MSVRLSICIEQLRSHCTGFNEIWYLSFIQKFVDEIKVLLKFDKNDGYLT